MTIDPNVAREEAKAVLALKDSLNQAIVSAWEKGLLINIVIQEREHVVARVHPYPCPQLTMGVAVDPLSLEDDSERPGREQ